MISRLLMCCVLLTATIGSLWAGPVQGSAYPGGERPNVLWLIAEDLGPELTCYGHPQVRTPIAAELISRVVR